MRLYRAHYQSRHFDFEAYGRTEASALLALRQTLAAHASQYGIADRQWFDDDDLYAYPIEIGKGLRDRSPIGGTND